MTSTLDAALINGPMDRESADVIFRKLAQWAHDRSLTLRPPPPEPTTCCGRGCNGCVWEGFFAAASYWREDALLAIQAKTELLSNPSPKETF